MVYGIEHFKHEIEKMGTSYVHLLKNKVGKSWKPVVRSNYLLTNIIGNMNCIIWNYKLKIIGSNGSIHYYNRHEWSSIYNRSYNYMIYNIGTNKYSIICYLNYHIQLVCNTLYR